MFCPACGSEERQMSQYCRACGTDLRPVRVSLERPDSITASAVSAREDIGRAVAEKIREVEDADDLKRVAEDVLPEIEKFLESPDEKRLRRMRAGVITASVGFGAGILALLMTTVVNGADVEKFVAVFGLAVVTFMIGLGLVLNGVLFTRPRKERKDSTPDARLQNLLDARYTPSQLRSGSEGQSLPSPTTSDFSRPELRAGSSVTEQTTRHLETEL
jgi:hypothetical protein